MTKNQREGKGWAREGVSNKMGRALWGLWTVAGAVKMGAGARVKNIPGESENIPHSQFSFGSAPYKLYFQQILIHKCSLPKDLPA